jgi:hypothetical protein
MQGAAEQPLRFEGALTAGALPSSACGAGERVLGATLSPGACAVRDAALARWRAQLRHARQLAALDRHDATDRRGHEWAHVLTPLGALARAFFGEKEDDSDSDASGGGGAAEELEVAVLRALRAHLGVAQVRCGAAARAHAAPYLLSLR